LVSYTLSKKIGLILQTMWQDILDLDSDSKFSFLLAATIF